MGATLSFLGVAVVSVSGEGPTPADVGSVGGTVSSFSGRGFLAQEFKRLPTARSCTLPRTYSLCLQHLLPFSGGPKPSVLTTASDRLHRANARGQLHRACGCCVGCTCARSRIRQATSYHVGLPSARGRVPQAGTELVSCLHQWSSTSSRCLPSWSCQLQWSRTTRPRRRRLCRSCQRPWSPPAMIAAPLPGRFGEECISVRIVDQSSMCQCPILASWNKDEIKEHTQQKGRLTRKIKSITNSGDA